MSEPSAEPWPQTPEELSDAVVATGIVPPGCGDLPALYAAAEFRRPADEAAWRATCVEFLRDGVLRDLGISPDVADDDSAVRLATVGAIEDGTPVIVLRERAGARASSSLPGVRIVRRAGVVVAGPLESVGQLTESDLDRLARLPPAGWRGDVVVVVYARERLWRAARPHVAEAVGEGVAGALDAAFGDLRHVVLRIGGRAFAEVGVLSFELRFRDGTRWARISAAQRPADLDVLGLLPAAAGGEASVAVAGRLQTSPLQDEARSRVPPEARELVDPLMRSLTGAFAVDVRGLEDDDPTLVIMGADGIRARHFARMGSTMMRGQLHAHAFEHKDVPVDVVDEGEGGRKSAWFGTPEVFALARGRDVERGMSALIDRVSGVGRTTLAGDGAAAARRALDRGDSVFAFSSAPAFRSPDGGVRATAFGVGFGSDYAVVTVELVLGRSRR